MLNLDRFKSISQDRSAQHTSAKYSFIPTTKVLDILESENWLPVKAIEARVMKESNDGFWSAIQAESHRSLSPGR